MHLDDPASGVTFPTKTNLDAEGTQRCLCATQPAGQRAGILRPAAASAQSAVTGKIGPGSQQVGCAGPGTAFGHDLAHAGGHRIGEPRPNLWCRPSSARTVLNPENPMKKPILAFLRGTGSSPAPVQSSARFENLIGK
jgi:hypothetical protein